MDKIAAGIVDKLSLIGFFNVIISGGILLYGISPVIGEYAPGVFYDEVGLENNLEQVIVIGLMSYVLGSTLQSLQGWFFRNQRARIVNQCLSETLQIGEKLQIGSVLTNRYKRQEAIELATKLFASRKLGEFDPENPEMCQYFFDLCESINSLRGQNGKAERMNESAAFYEQLAMVFFVMTTVGIILTLLGRRDVWLYCIFYLAIALIFTGRAHYYRLSWVKTVIATYEASAVLDRRDM